MLTFGTISSGQKCSRIAYVAPNGNSGLKASLIKTLQKQAEKMSVKFSVVYFFIRHIKLIFTLKTKGCYEFL